jgi:hypothetical protein
MSTTASPAQINLIKGKLSALQRAAEALPEGDPSAVALEALLTSKQIELGKVLGGMDIDKRTASTVIDVLFAAERVVPPAEIRWVKEGATFLIKGAASVLVPGATVTAVSQRGEREVVVDRVVRVEGPVAFATTRFPEPAASADGLDLHTLFEGLLTQAGDAVTTIYVADPEGDEDDSRLKLQIDAPRSGKWAGWVFVKDGAVYGSGQRYGAQRPGSRYSGKVEDVLTRVLADRRGAMARYGRLVGACGRCGRTLEHKDSIELGLGPWCATQV